MKTARLRPGTFPDQIMTSSQFLPRVHRARAILDVVARAYPGAWAAMDQFRGARGRDGIPRWPEWCYVPLHAAYAVVSGGGSNRVSVERSHHVGIVGAMAAWRMGMQVIRYDPAVYAPLVATPINGDLPAALLYRLPAWGLYVETPDLTMWGRALHGFFVHLDWSDGAADELRLVLDLAESPEVALDAGLGLVPMPIILGSGTVADSVARVVESGRRQMQAAGYAGLDPVLSDVQSIARELAPLLSLVLYLCSEAPDWEGAGPANPQPVRIRRGGWRLFPAQGLEVWEVGTRLGAGLRAAYHAAETGRGEHDPETGRARPRAHVRRAHWHTFLAGAGRAERRLRWLPPIPVNLEAVDGLPTTIRPVKP
jgi:hypothetical protein